MQTEKKLQKFAKGLAELSLEEGVVSAEKVEAVLQTLKKRPPLRLKTVLKHYLYYIKKEIDRSRAIIEYAGAPDDSSIATIHKNLTETYRRNLTLESRENSSLIAGFRIAVGDDLYDASVTGRLANLSKSVR